MKVTSWRILGLALGVLVTGSVCYCADVPGGPEEGLVAYWRFDQEVGDVVRDVSGNGHDGKIKGDVGRVEGRVGKAVCFNGDKGCGVVVPDADDLNCTTAITIEAWVKPDKLKREAQYEILNKAGDRGPGYRLRVSWGSLALVSGEGYGKDHWNVSANLALTPLTEGLWHHIAATYDGQVYRIYLDGVEVASGGTLHHEKENVPLDGATHPITVNDKPLTIGSFSAGYAYVFKGAIDEVKVYSRAKSAAEVFRAAKEF